MIDYNFILLVFLISLIIYFIIYFIKKKLLKSFKVSPLDIESIFSNRGKGKFNLTELINNYGEQCFKTTDAICRKGYHFFYFSSTIVLCTFVSQNIYVNIITGIFAAILVLMVAVFLYVTNADNFFSKVFFSPIRIRDGINGRLNGIMAVSSTIVGMSTIFILFKQLQPLNLTYVQQVFIAYTFFIPLTVGDACAEFFGAIWGNQKLKVYGIGEINKKSYLGTLAFILSVLITEFLCVFLFKVPPVFYIMALLITLITSVVELLSPRGTDNFFIPFSTFLVMSFFLKNGFS